MTLWGGRFEEATDDSLRQFGDSIAFDRRMYRADIRGSVAYAAALLKVALITEEEHNRLVEGLEQVKAEFDADPNLQTMGKTAQGEHPGSSWPAEPNAFFDAISAQNILCDMMQRTITDGLSPADAVKEAEERIARIADEMEALG